MDELKALLDQAAALQTQIAATTQAVAGYASVNGNAQGTNLALQKLAEMGSAAQQAYNGLSVQLNEMRKRANG